jgi:hypothetical protein
MELEVKNVPIERINRARVILQKDSMEIKRVIRMNKTIGSLLLWTKTFVEQYDNLYQHKESPVKYSKLDESKEIMSLKRMLHIPKKLSIIANNESKRQ